MNTSLINPVDTVTDPSKHTEYRDPSMERIDLTREFPHFLKANTPILLSDSQGILRVCLVEDYMKCETLSYEERRDTLLNLIQPLPSQASFIPEEAENQSTLDAMLKGEKKYHGQTTPLHTMDYLELYRLHEQLLSPTKLYDTSDTHMAPGYHLMLQFIQYTAKKKGKPHVYEQLHRFLTSFEIPADEKEQLLLRRMNALSHNTEFTALVESYQKLTHPPTETKPVFDTSSIVESILSTDIGIKEILTPETPPTTDTPQYLPYTVGEWPTVEIPKVSIRERRPQKSIKDIYTPRRRWTTPSLKPSFKAVRTAVLTGLTTILGVTASGPLHPTTTPVNTVDSHVQTSAPKVVQQEQAVDHLALAKQDMYRLFGHNASVSHWLFPATMDMATSKARMTQARDTLAVLRDHGGISLPRLHVLTEQAMAQGTSFEEFLDNLTTLPEVKGGGYSHMYLQYLQQLHGWTYAQALASDAYAATWQSHFAVDAPQPLPHLRYSGQGATLGKGGSIQLLG